MNRRIISMLMGFSIVVVLMALRLIQAAEQVY